MNNENNVLNNNNNIICNLMSVIILRTLFDD